MNKLFFLILLVSIWSCSQEEVILPDQLVQIEYNLPPNWEFAVQTNQFTSGTIVEGFHSPDAIAVFVNREVKYKNMNVNIEKSPSLVLNFFLKERKAEVDSVMKNYFSVFGCNPVLYDETSEFLIISSPCLQNHGFTSDEAERLIAPLNQSLHTYFKTIE